MKDLAGLLIGIAPVLAALVWCNARDRRMDLANRLCARVNQVVNRRLGGESLVAVRVDAALGPRAGRVHLSVPGSHESLIGLVSGTVLRELPANYELVVHGATAPAGR